MNSYPITNQHQQSNKNRFPNRTIVSIEAKKRCDILRQIEIKRELQALGLEVDEITIS